jgi:hypothetical protein
MKDSPRHEIVTTGCAPAKPPEMPPQKINYPKATAIELAAGAIEVEIHPSAGGYRPDWTSIIQPKAKP